MCFGLLKEDGKTIGFQVIGRDISERKKTMDALRTSENKYRTLLENLPQKIFFKDKNSVYIACNENYARDLKIKSNEIAGKTDYDFYPKKLAEKYRADDRRLMESGKTEDIEEEYIQDGQKVFVHTVKTPVKDENGDVVGILGIFWDITESKKMREALTLSEEKFRNIFESVDDCMIYLDRSGRILDVNEKAVEVFSGSKNELLGKHFTKVGVFSLRDIPTLMSSFAKILAGKKVIINTNIRNKKGQEIPLECSASLMKTDDKLAGMMVIARNITERHKAEQILRESREKLAVINEKLGVVGKLTRHDARNKLSTVTMNTFLAKQKLPSDHEALKHLSEIESACGEVEKIFEFARIYEKIGVEELAYMNVEKTFEEAVMLFSDLHDVKVANDCHGLTLLADSLLRQLFYNLIDNSLKYGERVSRIRMYCEEAKKDQLKLIYEDDGIGIPNAEKEKIFKEGYGKGTGYGLYLIRKMCEVYGWTIKETGKQGKGAQFTITIPKIGERGKVRFKLH